MKTLTIATGLFLALSLGAASANPFYERTEAGAGLFDQGGELYDHSASTTSPSFGYGYPGVSLESTASVTMPATTSAVPADNPRNEPGQAMFDIQR